MLVSHHQAACLVVLALLAPVCVQAGEQARTNISESVYPGDQVNTWLTLQRSGVAASTHAQAATREQREKAADRFFKTYDYPIKESYYSSTFKTGN